MKKTEPKYKSLLSTATTTLDGTSCLYVWVLAGILFIIGVSFGLLAIWFENFACDYDDFEPLDDADLVSFNPHTPAESTLFSRWRTFAYSQSSHTYKDKGYHIATSPDNITSVMTVYDDMNRASNQNTFIIKNDNFQLFCYYGLPTNESSLMPNQIDADLCTHILIAFAEVSVNNTLVHLKPYLTKYFIDIVALKKQNPKLKILISVTDSNTGNFGKAAASREARIAFAESTRDFLARYNLDGVDLDWEFPAWPGPFKTDEKRLFRKLLQQIRSTLQDNYLLTVAAAAPQPIIDRAYEMFWLARLVDFVSIMGYDYHSYIWYFPILGPNAPLYPARSDSGYLSSLNSNWSVNYYLSKGIPANKLLLGVPTYGHSFTLVNPKSTDYGMPAADVGKIGQNGFVDYIDTVEFLNRENTVEVFDRDTRVPYAFNGYQWISFDNEQSLAYKTEYLMLKGLAGAMVWSLNTDDYAGKYHKDSFPLTRAVKMVLNDNNL